MKEESDLDIQYTMKNISYSINSEALPIIMKQVNQSVCKILKKDGKGIATGFLCKIPFPNAHNLLLVFISSYHTLVKTIIEKKQIELKFYNEEKTKIIKLDNSRKVFISDEKKYDIIMIEIKNNDGIDMNNFLEIDNYLYKCDNLDIIYNNHNIYLIHFPNGLKSKISFGKIKKVNENNYDIEHISTIGEASSGCPIFNILNYKIIGIHKPFNKELIFLSEPNLGTTLKLPINEFFIQENQKSLNMTEKINKNNIDYVEKIIQRLLTIRRNNSQKQIDLKEEEIIYIIDKSLTYIKSQDSLVKLNSPIKVCGDIRAQYYDLLNIFDNFGYPGEYNYLFLGNYIDGVEKKILETLCLLLCYKIKYPEKITLLRGGHESSGVNRIYGLYDEIIKERKYNIRLWILFNHLFNYLPIGALIGKKIFCNHGGLSPDLRKLEHISNIKRPIDISDSEFLCDLLNSAPDEFESSFSEVSKGHGFIFGKKPVLDFIQNNNLDLIIRGRTVVDNGFEFFADKKLLTIFSVPNFAKEFDNCAAIANIDEKLYVSFQIIKSNLIAKEGLLSKINCLNA